MLLAVNYLSELLPMTFRKYEIDLGRGIFKSDGDEDHQRMREALSDIERIGPFKTSPQPPEGVPFKAVGLRMMDLAEKFFLLRKNLKPATALAYKKTAAEFAGFIGNPIISDIDRSDVTRWQEHIAKFNSVRTIDNKIGNLCSLINFGIKQGYYFGENPAAGRKLLTNKQKIEGSWELFEAAEIKAAFAPEHRAIWKKKDPNFYFASMLALLTGCRISEITSLTRAQIRSDPVPYIKILVAKTPAGIRDIPIPQVFFDEFLAFLPKSGPIFKYSMRLGKGSGNAVSQKFQRHLKAIEVARPKLVFHSLRGFANDLFMKSGVKYEPRCQVMGHEIANVNVGIYSNKFAHEQLAEILEPIQVKLLASINWKQ